MTHDDRRGQDRRAGDRRDRAEGRALVPAGELRDETAVRTADPARRTAGAAAVEAQMIGQTGVRRGLKGGPPVLEAARSAYLEAEFSGPQDRRPRTGRTHRTDI